MRKRVSTSSLNPRSVGTGEMKNSDEVAATTDAAEAALMHKGWKT